MKLTEKQKLLKRLRGFCKMLGDDLNTIDPDLVGRISDSIKGLSKPTKVAIGGLAGSQHQTVAEFFLGTELFQSSGDAEKYPTVRVRYGKAPRTHAVTGKNRKTVEGIALKEALGNRTPDWVEIEMPNPVVSEIDFTILTDYVGEDNRARYLVNLLEDTDVIVWCSRATTPWLPHERRLWFTVPETLKDRSILALTGAEGLIDGTARQVLNDKSEMVSDDFACLVPIAVDIARAAAPAGEIIAPNEFAASGGQEMLKQVKLFVQDSRADLLIEARSVRAEIDRIPLGGVQADAELNETVTTPSAPEVSAPAPDNAPSVSPALEIEADPVDRLRGVLRDGATKCKTVLSDCSGGDYTPLFAAITEMFTELSGLTRTGWELEKDHALMVAQLSEATELVTLLGYENNETAAREAAEIVRQIGADFWTRIQASSTTSTRNLSDYEQFSAAG